MEIADLFQGTSVSLKIIRGVVWAALQDHHPGVDLRAAGEIIDQAGMPSSMDAIGRAFKAAFPTAQNTEPEKTGSHPRKAKAG